jgi:S-adenosylmethionine:tRNA-ribosyltransferase-isomerase (queuine synthetase)
MKQKKPTMKEVVAKVEMLNRVNTTVIDMIDNLGDALKQYIEFKDDAKDFHEYQKEILEIRTKIKGETNNA